MLSCELMTANLKSQTSVAYGFAFTDAERRARQDQAKLNAQAKRDRQAKRLEKAQPPLISLPRGFHTLSHGREVDAIGANVGDRGDDFVPLYEGGRAVMSKQLWEKLKPYQLEGVRFMWRNIVQEHAGGAAGSQT
eukprot:scaffold21193_cov45-Prasinocladus_malaysianus.AAC.3